jgi:hypothetical protein
MAKVGDTIRGHWAALIDDHAPTSGAILRPLWLKCLSAI